jgi:hypothetical protein
LFGLRFSEAPEEEGLRPEIQQRDSVSLVECPLTRGHDSKHRSQARDERMERWMIELRVRVLYIGGGARLHLPGVSLLTLVAAP